MTLDSSKQKTVVIGAGPVGALAALYAAQRGHDVEVYELRGDPRDPKTTPLNFTKSINLALSERGINAMRHCGHPGLLDKVLSETIPMGGRMIHGKDRLGELYHQAQEYDIHGRALHAVDRGDLNRKLLDELEGLPNVTLFFHHKLTGADFNKHKAWLENTTAPLTNSPTARHEEIEISFDLLIGCDGAHSAARYHMMKYLRMDYKQEYIDTLWCEFTIPPTSLNTDTSDNSSFRISPNHLHIWPGQDIMFIAIPSFDGSFTCTLFMPSAYFSKLEADPSSVPSFFEDHFPGVSGDLITESALVDSFARNPHLPLISITCAPHHYTDSAVILGDAAHAMVPFYGQGMNAGLEDVRILFQTLDNISVSASTPVLKSQRALALQSYSTQRTPDAHAINALALENYTEMRSSVTSPVYKARKWLEEKLSIWVPSLGWTTKYTRVSFGNERYSEVVRISEHQGRLLGFGLLGIGGGLLVTGIGLALRLRRRAGSGLFGW